MKMEHEHEVIIALDRYPTCSCGCGTWPCDRGAYAERCRKAFEELDEHPEMGER